MDVSVSRSSTITEVAKKDLNEQALKNIRREPLNLNLPDLNSSNSDNLSMTNSKGFVPNAPIFGHENDPIRLTESGLNSAKIEMGRPGEKAILTVSARNEGINNEKSHISVNSPYLKDMARDYAKETVMDSVVTPLRNTLGKTVADTTLGTAVIATALISAKHLPDGHANIGLPINKLTSDKELKASIIVGYGAGSNLKATGVELKDKFQLKGDNEMEVKVSYRKNVEVNGNKNANEAKVEATIVNPRKRWNDGVVTMGIEHNNVTGTTAGVYYHKSF
ncbi:MAG: hypothetical protein H7263_11730 [Candidatus Sericytochromatia bacterium]|nr:hypothetical protein [Candidatus Sericytochromatia bacterium]